MKDTRVRDAILRLGAEIIISGIRVQMKPHTDKETKMEIPTDIFVAWGRQVEKTSPLSERELTKYFDTKHQDFLSAWRGEEERSSGRRRRPPGSRRRSRTSRGNRPSSARPTRPRCCADSTRRRTARGRRRSRGGWTSSAACSRRPRPSGRRAPGAAAGGAPPAGRCGARGCWRLEQRRPGHTSRSPPGSTP
ncbi:unnamed protein product [Prorocentrum cordatum]|uniref:Uncharacterized protein n=1 Tax=Prorocentrum cordatum TaxID=2364126 RepID=A0ABN9XA74_9DINO|nr:unnamed protein product [Polarella glacialis]